jgi:hypothetical protein
VQVVLSIAVCAAVLGSVAIAAPARNGQAERRLFQGWLRTNLSRNSDDEDIQNLVYGYALIDLNGDGRNEAIVWARNASRCGTGGCGLDVYVHQKSGWYMLSHTPITRPPIKILNSRTNGWHDLASWQAGGGIQRPYEARLRFNGVRYEIVWPKDWTGKNPPAPLKGRTLISDATIALYPTKCRKSEEAQSAFGPIAIHTGQQGSC